MQNIFILLINIVLTRFKLLFFAINIVKQHSVVVAIKHLFCDVSWPPVNVFTREYN